MAIKLTDKEDVEAASGAFPFGRIKDDTGAGDGTPVDRKTYGDFHQFFEKLMFEAGISHNGLEDNETDGFQLYQALLKIFQSEDWNKTDLYENALNHIYFRKDKFGFVYVVGVLHAGGTALVLPAGYRPSVREVFPTMGVLVSKDIAYGKDLYIEADGTVTCPTFGIGMGNTNTVLVNFSFKAA